MNFLEKRLAVAEERLAKALNPRYSSADKERQAEYYRQQIAEIKRQMEKGKI